MFRISRMHEPLKALPRGTFDRIVAQSRSPDAANAESGIPMPIDTPPPDSTALYPDCNTGFHNGPLTTDH